MLTGFQAILFSHINLYFGIVLALNAYIFLEMIDSCWAQGKRAEAVTGMVVMLLTGSAIILFNNIFSTGITIGTEHSTFFIKPLKYSCAMGFFFGFWSARLISEALIYLRMKIWDEMTVLMVLAVFVLAGAVLIDAEMLYGALAVVPEKGAVL